MFEPKDGEVSRREHCVELIRSREPREAITYQEVMELLDCDRAAAQAAMDEARRTIEADGERSVYTVTNFGWIRCSAFDMLTQGQRRARKAQRAARRTVRGLRVASAHRSELEPMHRAMVDYELSQATALAELHARRARIPLAEIERRARED